MPVEIELKLAVPLKHSNRLLRLPLLESLSTSSPRTHKLYSIYYDTPDYYLKNHGIAFRLRRNGRRWIQTVKDKGHISAGLFQHRELEVPVKNAQPDYTKIIDPELKKIFNNPALAQQLQPIFSTQFTRNTRLLHLEDGSKVEFCLDRGKISTIHTSMPLCEIELELKSGDATQLFLLALALQKVFPFSLRLENASKAERGYTLCSGCKRPPIKAIPVPLNADMCVNTAVKTIGWDCLGHLSSNENGMLKELAFEYLHQMHASLRRQQSVLKIFSQAFPEESMVSLTQELKWLTAQFNSALDWDVFITTTLQTIQDRYTDHPGIDMLMRACKQLRHQHQKTAHRTVKSNRYLKTMLRLGAWLSAEPLPNQLKKNTLELANTLLNKQHQQLKNHGKTLMELNASDLRSLRITTRKQCDVTEFFSDFYPNNKTSQYLRALHKLHDILCAMNANSVTKKLLNEVKITKKKRAQNEAMGILLGWTLHHQLQKEIELNRAWNSFNRISPFWPSETNHKLRQKA
jgi:inorganic triphosphatase YgiF